MWDVADEALLAGLGTGDTMASAVFVRRFQRKVYGLALSITGDEGRASEVAQDAFLRAWRHASAYDPRRGSVISWLLGITRNLAIDRLRVERVRPADPVDPLNLVPLVVDDDPASAALTGDETRRVVAALGSLPEDQRRALVLASLWGRTAREIAELERIPLGTAKTRIRAAMMRVRTVLASEEEVRRDD